MINKFRAPTGNVNLERSYEICRAVVQKSVNRNQVEHQLVTAGGSIVTTGTSLSQTVVAAAPIVTVASTVGTAAVIAAPQQVTVLQPQSQSQQIAGKLTYQHFLKKVHFVVFSQSRSQIPYITFLNFYEASSKLVLKTSPCLYCHFFRHIVKKKMSLHFSQRPLISHQAWPWLEQSTPRLHNKAEELLF